jgi:hypothetical protein
VGSGLPSGGGIAMGDGLGGGSNPSMVCFIDSLLTGAPVVGAKATSTGKIQKYGLCY